MSFPGVQDNVPNVSAAATITSSGTNYAFNAINNTQLGVGLNPTRALFEARLTYVTGTPIPTADQVGKSTLFLTSMNGGRISIFDGTSNWYVSTLASDASIALSGLTNGLPYDVFVYLVSTTITLELVAWTNGTTRATALVLQDGIYVKSGATSHRYVGTAVATGATTGEDSAQNRLLWNLYQQVPRPLYRADSTASWTYTTASWHQANASASNQVTMISGLGNAFVHLDASGIRSNALASIGATAIGLNSTTTPVAGSIQTTSTCVATGVAAARALYDGYPGLGYNKLNWLEYGSGGGTDTWYGTSGQYLTGLTGFVVA